MRYKVTIETSTTSYAKFRFEGHAKGGPGLVGCIVAPAETRQGALDAVRKSVEAIFPEHSFDFVHTPA